MPVNVTEGIRWILTCTTHFDETVAFFRNVMGLSVSEEGVPVPDAQFTRYALLKTPKEQWLPLDGITDLTVTETSRR